MFSKDFPGQRQHVRVEVWGLWGLFKTLRSSAEIQETAKKTDEWKEELRVPASFPSRKPPMGGLGSGAGGLPLLGFGSLQQAGL